MLATAAVLALVVVVAAVSAGSVLLAAGRAQDAADAAALAAADARAAAVSPVTAASRAAAAHGGTLVACHCATAVVTVTVGVPVSAMPARLLGITSRTASARARLIPAADTAALVERRMRERGVTFKQAISDAIRAGLGADEGGQFVTETASMGRSRVALDRALQVAADLADDELLRRMRGAS